MTKNIFTILMLVGLPFFLVAQTQLSGKITDAKSGEGLIGANVLIQGTNNGTVTDLDGNYELSINGDVVLEISYTGYADQTISVSNSGGSITQDIALATDALQLQDVVVTANKRSQVSQKVPSSISTLSPVDLQRTGAFEAEDYFSSIPNLSQTASGAGGASFGDGRASGKNVAIRGVSGTNTTAMYLDDTPLPEFADPKLFDVSRVEVLRGPQGTLYGSSTMGGAIKVVTNKPNVYKTEGSIEANIASVTEGDLDYNVQGIVNIPLAEEKVALRVGGFYGFKTGVYDRRRQTHFNGFPLNTSDGSQAGTGQIILDPNTGNNVPYTDAPIPLTFLDTPERQNGLTWSEGEDLRENIDDEKTFGFNAALGFYPTKNVSIIPKVIIQRTEGSGYDFADFRPDNFDQYRTAGIDERYELDLSHYSLLSKFTLTKGEIVNSLSYSKIDQLDFEDITEVNSSGGGGSSFGPPFGLRGGNIMANANERTGNLTKLVEELRFVSDLGGKFDFTAGIFYSSEKSKFDVYKERPVLFEIIDIPGTPVFYTQDTDINTDEFAFFGELYYDLAANLKVTAGFRFFNASQDFNQLIGGLVADFNDEYDRTKSDESGFNPKLNLTYTLNENSLIYAGASRGFRLGGGNPFVPVIFAGDDLAALGLTEAPLTFESDFIWSYEVGSKNTLANNRLILNAAVYHNVWNDLQQRVFLPSGFLFLDNVGSATITGLEVDLQGKVSKNLQVGAAIGIADAKVKEGSDFTGSKDGDRILNVPEFTASGNLQYTHGVGSNEDNNMFYRVDIQHTGERVNTFNPESDPGFVFDAFTMVNARIGYTTPKYEIALFGKNVFNTIANLGDITSLAATPFGRTRYATSRPASFGVSLKFNFR